MKISYYAARILIGATTAWIGAAVVIWLFGEPWFTGFDELVSISFVSLMIIASLALAGIFLLLLGSTYNFTSTMGKVWMLLGIGVFLWLVGEFIFFMYDLQGIEPFPSIADYFYYAAYGPIAAGLIIQVRLLKVKLKGLEATIIVIISVLSGLTISYFVLWPAFASFIEAPYDPIVLIAGTMYTVLDIVLLIFVYVVSAKLRHGKINAAWILVLVGLVMTTVADSLYWIADFNGIDITFNWYDLAFIISYLLIVMGAIKGINIISTTFST
ncbi:MAG: hypothetical protein Q6373_022730 [Candidatus Sigynarchaeota archaeon]